MIIFPFKTLFPCYLGGNRKQKTKNDLDPVRQIKRIKKIEKKFERELRQEKLKPKEEQPAPTSETNQIGESTI